MLDLRWYSVFGIIIVYRGDIMQKKDLLQRDRFIYNIEKYIDLFLQDDSKSAVIAIDGKWGCGKTFVVEKLIENIDVLKYKNEAERNRRYFISYYNSWKYDYYDEPVVAIINNLLGTLESFNQQFQDEEYSKRIKVNKIFNIIGVTASDVMQHFTGINLKSILGEMLDLTSKYDKNADLQIVISKLREELKRITKYIPLVIVVDELDRCIPYYAIKVLERLHHIFEEIENVVLVVVMDKSQLEHSIESIFGPKVDTDRYLKKFIDVTLCLDAGNLVEDWIEEYEEQLFEAFRTHDQWYNYNAYYPEMRSFIRILLDTISIREKEKILKKAVLIYKLLENESDSVLNECICSFLIMYLIAIEKYTIQGDIKWIGECVSVGGCYEIEQRLDRYQKYNDKEMDKIKGNDRFVNFLSDQIEVAFDKTEGNHLNRINHYVPGICLSLFAYISGNGKVSSNNIRSIYPTVHRIMELCEFLK